jgi:hypothetical protein
MSEKWRISRVGKLELEVGETLQEAIIRLQILPLPPVAWTDCFLQTVRGHEVTIIGTKPTQTRLRPSHVLPKLRTCSEKSTPRLRTPTSTLKRWCVPGGKPTVTLRVLKPTRGRNYRPRLTSSRKSSPNPNTPKTRVPTESHLLRRSVGEGVGPYSSTDAPRRAIPRRDGGSPRQQFRKTCDGCPSRWPRAPGASWTSPVGRAAVDGAHRCGRDAADADFLDNRKGRSRCSTWRLPPFSTPNRLTTPLPISYRRVSRVSRKRGFTYCEEVHRRRRARLRVWGLPRSPVASFPHPGHGPRAHARRC